MDDVNWQGETRQLTMDLIRKKSKEKLLKDVETLRRKMKDVESTQLIREDSESD